MLLNTHKYRHTETVLIFNVSVSMSRPKSIMSNLCDLFFNFIFIFIIINHIISLKQKHLFFLQIFYNMSNNISMITWIEKERKMKKANNVQVAKFQSQGVA